MACTANLSFTTKFDNATDTEHVIAVGDTEAYNLLLQCAIKATRFVWRLLGSCKLFHPAEGCNLTQQYRTQIIDISCRCFPVEVNCTLWLDFSGCDYPFVDTAFVEQRGDVLLKQGAEHKLVHEED